MTVLDFVLTIHYASINPDAELYFLDDEGIAHLVDVVQVVDEDSVVLRSIALDGADGVPSAN